jgi:energy-coupling factor transporter ATP-binding protein EcfA2
VITRIEIERFKSLKHVELSLGSFNLFVGTNASGKSNLFDALRVLQGIGYGFTVNEILNGKPKSASSQVWEPIRGGSSKAEYQGNGARGGEDRAFETGVKAMGLGDHIVGFSVSLRPGGRKDLSFDYSIGISPALGTVRNESLVINDEQVYDSSPIENSAQAPTFTVRYYKGTKGRQPHFAFEKTRPVLHQILQQDQCSREDTKDIGILIASLSNSQRIDPSPALLREYSAAQAVSRMGERGENFAALIKTIIADPQTNSAYLSWLQQLTPTDLDGVTVLKGALDEPLFAVTEHGLTYPAPVLSDGTLRFAAIAAAFFQPDVPELLTIEEIENGIHPSRIRLLVELLKMQSNQSRQVMATTHSPIVLAWLRQSDYRTTFFCKRDEDSGASEIAPLSEVPNFLEIVKKQPIGDLFAEAWLEGAL